MPPSSRPSRAIDWYGGLLTGVFASTIAAPFTTGSKRVPLIVAALVLIGVLVAVVPQNGPLRRRNLGGSSAGVSLSVVFLVGYVAAVVWGRQEHWSVVTELGVAGLGFAGVSALLWQSVKAETGLQDPLLGVTFLLFGVSSSSDTVIVGTFLLLIVVSAMLGTAVAILLGSTTSFGVASLLGGFVIMLMGVELLLLKGEGVLTGVALLLLGIEAMAMGVDSIWRPQRPSWFNGPALHRRWTRFITPVDRSSESVDGGATAEDEDRKTLGT